MSPPATLGGVALLCVGAAIAGIAWGGGAPVARAAADEPVLLSSFSCAPNWRHAKPGPQVIRVRNVANVTMDEADLIDPTSGRIYAELENMGPDTTAEVRVDLANGLYAWRCLPDGLDAVTGASARVTGGSGSGSPGVLPVNRNELTGPAKQYQGDVAAGLRVLTPEVAALRSDIASDDLARARSDWLTAHLQYERLGGAYQAFGALGDAIDGLKDGLPGGVNDPGFTGFHRIEYGLWHGGSAAALTPYADQLVRDVGTLRERWATLEIDPVDLGLRAHEILEDSLRFELSGDSDMGSGSNLATMSANVDGTETVLRVLEPLARTRYPRLPQVYQWLDRLRSRLAALRGPGGWTPVETLTTTQREQLDATTSECLELLAPIAAIFDVRRTP